MGAMGMNGFSFLRTYTNSGQGHVRGHGLI